jgi:hypothetical protein
MAASMNVFSSPVGTFTSITFGPDEPKVPEKPLRLVLVLDISGSMGPNMAYVVSTSLASVDLLENGASLRILAFDHAVNVVLEETLLTSDNRASIKERIKKNIVNRNGGTDLQSALIYALSGIDQSIMFMTDGLANAGSLTTSDDLVYLARRMPDYANNVVHCLGLQVHESDGINSDLLMTLAQDTNGTFKIARDPEAITCFLGDVMAAHFMTTRSNCKIQMDNSTLLTSTGLNGFSLRSDRPTTLVYRTAGGAAAAAATAAAMDPTADPADTFGNTFGSATAAAAAAAPAKPRINFYHNNIWQALEPVDSDMATETIFKAYASYLINQNKQGYNAHTHDQLLALLWYLKPFEDTVMAYVPLIIQLEKVSNGMLHMHDNAELSAALYDMRSSSCGNDSQQVVDFRNLARISSQNQC